VSVALFTSAVISHTIDEYLVMQHLNQQVATSKYAKNNNFISLQTW